MSDEENKYLDKYRGLHISVDDKIAIFRYCKERNINPYDVTDFNIEIGTIFLNTPETLVERYLNRENDSCELPHIAR